MLLRGPSNKEQPGRPVGQPNLNQALCDVGIRKVWIGIGAHDAVLVLRLRFKDLLYEENVLSTRYPPLSGPSNVVNPGSNYQSQAFLEF